MLEALLNHFRSYGMNDLEFIIVNSKLSHSQDKLHELQKLVSFPVYQETDEEEVWSVMEGGKDDMYVYDRCGRLTYFIPFPLSILNESPLVSNAILATYYRSPCGESCDQDKTLDVDEIVSYMETNFEESNTTEQENSVQVITELSVVDNETISDNENNGTLNLNDVLDVIASENGYDLFNFSDISNKTEFEYPAFNISSQLNERMIDKVKDFLSRTGAFFYADKSNETVKDANTTETPDDVTKNSTDVLTEPMTESHHRHHSHHHTHGHKVKKDQNGKKKSDRCVEADYEVCKNWSKKRLLFAQKCCSETRSEANLDVRRPCATFGKKRCKKIQSILKCCIKTVYTEPVTTTETTEEQTSSTEPSRISCCKTTDEGRTCRMLTSGECDEDEEKNPSQSK